MPKIKDSVEAAALEVIETMRLNGIPVPSSIGFAKLGKGVPAFYAHHPDELVLDERSRFWKDPVGEASRMRDADWWSTSNPRHPLIHEVGHAAHFKSDPRLYDTLKFRRWTPGELTSISGKVSKYAETHPSEFIAEVFAGLVDGATYDAQVMETYKMFRGFPVAR
jgi:hypothetical protein